MMSSPKNDELLRAIEDGFAYFNKAIPTVTMEFVGPIHREPYVKGDSDDEWCWVSIDEQAADERLPSTTKYLGSVSTRGDELFAAVVAYSLCKKFGEAIFDDAGYLNSGQEFTLAEFEETLKARLDTRI